MSLLPSRQIAFALAVSIPGLSPDDRPQAPADLLETAASAGSFGTLLTAVKAAGLEGVLTSEGPFTVLAPTDDAFAKLPASSLEALLRPEARGRLQQILRYHVIPGRISAADALIAGSAQTVDGDRLRVTLEEGRLRVEGAAVLETDIATENGVIHAIDSVLLPPSAEAAVSGPTPAALLELAIERGVPLFNHGQRSACAAIYEVAVAGLLTLPAGELPDGVRDVLARGLEQARGERDPADAAWTLRRAMDRAHAALVAAQERPTAPAVETASKEIVSFDDGTASARAWQVVNDTVMGGVSRSSMTASDGNGVFAGDLSLENNGGFASVHRAIEAGSLRGFAGLELRVRGDGNRYQLSINDEIRVTGDLYRAPFATKVGEWTVVRVPFSSMERSIMGFRPPGSKPLSPERVRSIGLSISDKQEGPFRLEIDSIRVYRADR